jgi:hypothetical protein
MSQQSSNKSNFMKSDQSKQMQIMRYTQVHNEFFSRFCTYNISNFKENSLFAPVGARLNQQWHTLDAKNK